MRRAQSRSRFDPDRTAGVPLLPEEPRSLAGTSALISNGRTDPIVAPEETERLAGLLRDAGADVEVAWQPGGHQLTRADVATARAWLERKRASVQKGGGAKPPGQR